MSSKREKLIRDPIHNVIAFNLNDEVEALLFRLIETEAVQRLRFVRQMGLASYVYPGAEHSRFAHSIGTQDVAKRLLAAMKPQASDFERATVRVAALLHDLGHAAFSHALESALSQWIPYHHEDLSTMQILEAGSEIESLLSAFDSKLPAAVAACIQPNGQAWYQGIVSSQLDADRMDYILRDGQMTGIQNYHFDLDRIVEMLEADQEGMLVSHRAMHAVETYLISRYHMYRQVYHHKTVRGGEKLLESVFKRAVHLASHGDDELFRCGRLGRLLQELVCHQDFQLRTMMAVDDAHAWVGLEAWSEHRDPCLSRLAKALKQRKFFKTLEIPMHAKSRLLNLWPELAAIVKKEGLEPDYDILLDTAHNKAFAPYTVEDPAVLPFVTEKNKKKHPSSSIRIIQASGRIAPIQELSPLVDMLSRMPEQVLRLCVHEACREQIRCALKAALILE